MVDLETSHNESGELVRHETINHERAFAIYWYLMNVRHWTYTENQFLLMVSGVVGGKVMGKSR